MPINIDAIFMRNRVFCYETFNLKLTPKTDEPQRHSILLLFLFLLFFSTSYDRNGEIMCEDAEQEVWTIERMTRIYFILGFSKSKRMVTYRERLTQTVNRKAFDSKKRKKARNK